jgi:hypothetical protein
VSLQERESERGRGGGGQRERGSQILGRDRLVDEVRVEDVELVTLDDLGRWVVVVVMRLVVFVPLVARVHPVEVLGLARSVFLVPPVHLRPNTRAS